MFLKGKTREVKSLCKVQPCIVKQDSFLRSSTNFGRTDKFSISIAFLKEIFQICASAVEIEKMNRILIFT